MMKIFGILGETMPQDPRLDRAAQYVAGVHHWFCCDETDPIKWDLALRDQLNKMNAKILAASSQGRVNDSGVQQVHDHCRIDAETYCWASLVKQRNKRMKLNLTNAGKASWLQTIRQLIEK